MSGHEDSENWETAFRGTVRLFPLPNLVLFPHVMQPLHIFEPRYRAMLEAALAHDGLIGMALLAPGWESDYEGRPPLLPVGCLGRVATHCRLEDGTYNLLLMGLRRFEIVEELPPAQLYREARVRLRCDCIAPHLAEKQAESFRRLQAVFARFTPYLPEARDQIDRLIGGKIDLPTLTDVIAYMMEIPVADKYALLAETDVLARAAYLLERLESLDASQPAAVEFPPRFSAN